MGGGGLGRSAGSGRATQAAQTVCCTASWRPGHRRRGHQSFDTEGACNTAPLNGLPDSTSPQRTVHQGSDGQHGHKGGRLAIWSLAVGSRAPGAHQVSCAVTSASTSEVPGRCASGQCTRHRSRWPQPSSRMDFSTDCLPRARQPHDTEAATALSGFANQHTARPARARSAYPRSLQSRPGSSLQPCRRSCVQHAAVIHPLSRPAHGRPSPRLSSAGRCSSFQILDVMNSSPRRPPSRKPRRPSPTIAWFL